MSTEIAEIKTQYQEYDIITDTVNYIDDKLHINRFAGGKEKGTMIQLTILNCKDGYTQLTKEQVKELAQILNDCFDYDKYPSE